MNKRQSKFQFVSMSVSISSLPLLIFWLPENMPFVLFKMCRRYRLLHLSATFIASHPEVIEFRSISANIILAEKCRFLKASSYSMHDFKQICYRVVCIKVCLENAVPISLEREKENIPCLCLNFLFCYYLSQVFFYRKF